MTFNIHSDKYKKLDYDKKFYMENNIQEILI